MSTTLTTSPIKVAVGWSMASTNSFGTDTVNSASFSWSKSFTQGTGASAARYMYVATLTIATSTTTTLDLDATAGTPILDIFGSNITMSKVRVIYVENASANAATNITVGGNANALVNWVSDKTDKVIIHSGGCMLIGCTDATAYGVTAATADKLDIANLDASNQATVNVFICGE